MIDTDFDVYAMTLQPGGAGEGADPYRFCRNKKIVGVGWNDLDSVVDELSFESLDDVRTAHQRKYENRKQQGKDWPVKKNGDLHTKLGYIFQMEVGDFVWVKEEDQYSLCKITGEWEIMYNLDDYDAYKYNDIVHFRPVNWTDVPLEIVPGYVENNFVGSKQPICKFRTGINEDSKEILYRMHSGEIDGSEILDKKRVSKQVAEADTEHIFEILTQDEIENLVIQYMNEETKWSITGQRKSSKPKVECEFRQSEDGIKTNIAYLQVKSGKQSLNPETYEKYAKNGRQIYFFVESGVSVEGRENMSKITPEEVARFISEKPGLIPEQPLLRLDLFLDSD